MGVDTKLAGPEDVETMSVALARAFGDDPIWEFILPDIEPEVRAERTLPFFRVESRAKVRTATAWTTADGMGSALWAPPDGWKTRTIDVARMAFPLMRHTRGRIFQALGVLQRVEREHPKESHWYLAVLGTDPDHQGKGIGAAVLDPVLERCDAEGLPAFLESSKESNIPYYERFGFRVMQELKVGKSAPSVWQMWRDPGTDG
jgi:ribosomal protein S18 acetylase RimI-like enzyme